MSKTELITGIESLQVLGAPENVLEAARKALDFGLELKLVRSETERPQSIQLLLNDEPLAKFTERVSAQVDIEENEALKADPRLQHAPVVQEREGKLHYFFGPKQFVQLMLARGIKIPKPEDPNSLGCDLLIDGKPFERTIEVIFDAPKEENS